MLVSLIPELPLENPFQDATDRFYVLPRLIGTVSNMVWPIKILRVAMETTQDLGACDATFYVRYTDSCQARTGEDADRVAIVRRIWDEQFDVFKIVGRTESYRSLGNGESTTSRETVVHCSKDIDSMEQSDMHDGFDGYVGLYSELTNLGSWLVVIHLNMLIRIVNPIAC